MDDRAEVPGDSVTGPVVVSNAMSSDQANARYGDRYGVDWTYPDPPTITVPLPELRRALAVIDIAATLDGELLSGPQERAVMTLRRTIRDAGHFCLHLPITECPVCTPSKPPHTDRSTGGADDSGSALGRSVGRPPTSANSEEPNHVR